MQRPFMIEFRFLAWVVVLSCSAVSAVHAENVSDCDIDAARRHMMAGRYEDAETCYRHLLADDETSDEARVGLGELYLMLGRYDEGLETLEKVQSTRDRSSEWYRVHSELLAGVGKYAEAVSSCRKAVEIDSRNTSARRLLGQLYETTGNIEAAIETYQWFIDFLVRRYPSDARALTDFGIAVHRHATLTQRSDVAQRLRYAMHELFQPAYERFDETHWPALIASGELLLSKYNLPQAREEFEAALKINSRLVPAHLGLARTAILSWAFEQAREHLDEALSVAPDHPQTRCVNAELAMAQREFSEAVDQARLVLEVNPEHQQALGILAAALFLERQPDQAIRVVTEAESRFRPTPVLRYELGHWLAENRRFSEAEKHLTQACELAGYWSTPMTTLGLMYMEIGDERQARTVLDESWALDPFNDKTFHTLNLLDELDEFSRKETRHFIVKTGQGEHAAVQPLFADELERIHADVCDRFKYKPPFKTIVEVFPEHHWFAIRITGRPFVHTIGACTGKVIAMDAPRVERSGRPFDWQRVLQHEFAHTVTLAMTRNRIPHWLTEGLAVWAEDRTEPWAWCQLLCESYRHGRLHALDEIDWAFVRPRRPDARTLAYAQSLQMVRYILDEAGESAIHRLLEAFDEDLTQKHALERVLGESPEAFMSAFEQWLSGRLREWNLPTAKVPSADQARVELSCANEQDKPRCAASLAEALLDEGEITKAAEVVDTALSNADDHRDLLTVAIDVTIAQFDQSSDVSLSDKQRKKLQSLAKRLLALDDADPQAAWVLARLAIEDNNPAEAIRHLKIVRATWPMAVEPCQLLREMYQETAQLEKALEQAEAYCELESWNLAALHEAVALMQTLGKHDLAIDWLRRGLRVDPYSRDIREELGRLLMREERLAEACEVYSMLTRLEPANASYHSKLALALHRAGRSDEARQSAQRAILIDPDSEAAVLLKP